MSPGVALEHDAVQAAMDKSIPVVGELAVAAHYLKSPVVAITGTNGKTTVTTMLGDIFKSAGKKTFVGGNIGIPLFDYLIGPQLADIVVLEVSSFQIDTAGGSAGFRPDVAILLNITPDHLDRYDSYSSYIASKFNLFAAQTSENRAILNADDPISMDRQELWPRVNTTFFGKDIDGRPGAAIEGKKIMLRGLVDADGVDQTEEFDLADTSLCTPPYLQNCAAAILAARLMGCSRQEILRGLSDFTPLAHRLTLVYEINGVRYYDDSKATNIGAVQSALEGMQQEVILIAGGRDKGGGYEMLVNLVKEKVKAALLIGEAADSMQQVFNALTSVEKAADLPEAVNRAWEIAAPGDAVLLSPACASFDMFSSYVHRGEIFRQAVMKLKERKACN